MTTLSRFSLYLGHKRGKDFLRANLDYLVDEMCFILRSIRQSTESNDIPSSTGEESFFPSGLMDSTYDDRIVRVVGAVFFEIQQEVSLPSQEDELPGNVVMLLRDLIHESLNVIDALCQSSTSYAEISREAEHTRHQSYSNSHTASFDYQRGQVHTSLPLSSLILP